MRYRYMLSVIGVLVGVSVAIVFAVVYHNPDTAAWGLASGTYDIHMRRVTVTSTGT